MESTYVPVTYPVSIKGVVLRQGGVLLLKNEREEWELPGGKLDAGESPEQCVVREIEEEVGWKTTIGPILDTWVYPVLPNRTVFIVTYGCVLVPDAPEPVISHEHKEAALFLRREVPNLNMPDGYKRSIEDWFSRQDSAR